jgi:hypothetical protein
MYGLGNPAAMSATIRTVAVEQGPARCAGAIGEQQARESLRRTSPLVSDFSSCHGSPRAATAEPAQRPPEPRVEVRRQARRPTTGFGGCKAMMHSMSGSG